MVASAIQRHGVADETVVWRRLLCRSPWPNERTESTPRDTVEQHYFSGSLKARKPSGKSTGPPSMDFQNVQVVTSDYQMATCAYKRRLHGTTPLHIARPERAPAG
jgi:hypothetical protein